MKRKSVTPKASASNKATIPNAVDAALKPLAKGKQSVPDVLVAGLNLPLPKLGQGRTAEDDQLASEQSPDMPHTPTVVSPDNSDIHLSTQVAQADAGPAPSVSGVLVSGTSEDGPGLGLGAAGVSTEEAMRVNAGLESSNVGLMSAGAIMGLRMLMPSSQAGRMPPTPTRIELDVADDGNPANGSLIRISFDSAQVKAGDKLFLKVMYQNSTGGNDLVFTNATVPHVITEDDLHNGYVSILSAATDLEGYYKAEAYFEMVGGSTPGPSAFQDKLYTLFSGVVHDDYMDSSLVFIDTNLDGKFTFTDANHNGIFDSGELSEPYTKTDASGKFTFSFNPTGAPILALGGVDTSSGKPNEGFVFEVSTIGVDPTLAGLNLVLSPITTVISGLADVLAANANQQVTLQKLTEAAQLVNAVLGLGVRDPNTLFDLDAVDASSGTQTQQQSVDLMVANRQLAMLMSAVGALVTGASGDGKNFQEGSHTALSALVQLILDKADSKTQASLVSASDLGAVLENAITHANDSGLAPDLREIGRAHV